MTGLTSRQWDALLFLHKFISEHGYSPTYRQIGAGLGLTSTSNIRRILMSLHERGCVTRISGRACSIAMTSEGCEQANRARRLALLSRETVAA